MAGIFLGNEKDINNKDENPFVTKEPGEFHCYLTNIGMIICFESKKDEKGNEYWDMPLVLETVSQRNPSIGEITRSQGFRPLVPFTKDTRFIPTPNNNMFAVEIKDDRMEAAYKGTAREIRAQMSGIVMPSVGENSGIIVGS